MRLYVSLQLVLWATSSPSRALFPARCVLPTVEPARRDPPRVNVAAAFIGQPMMPTPPPAQVSFVGLFAYVWLSGRCSRGLIGHLSFTLTVGTETSPSSGITVLREYLLFLCMVKCAASGIASILDLHYVCLTPPVFSSSLFYPQLLHLRQSLCPGSTRAATAAFL